MTGLPDGGDAGEAELSPLVLRFSDSNRRGAGGLHLLSKVVFGSVLLRRTGETGDKNAPTERRRLSTANAHRARMVSARLASTCRQLVIMCASPRF